MHKILIEASDLLGIELHHLKDSADLTKITVSQARHVIADFLDRELGKNRDQSAEPIIAAFGSMARQEMATGSDFDYLVILNQLESDPQRIQIYRQAANEALVALDASPPGASGLFGCVISGADLVNTIGLDSDTNLHLSRRILLLEESIGLNSKDQHKHLIQAIVARYLHEHQSDHLVPRFLLNDVVRYWRTIAVDYQAKRWDAPSDNKLGLRYIKLITSRKLTFAGMLASLFMPAVAGKKVTTPSLTKQFSMPATARIAQLAQHVGDGTQQHLRDVLLYANEFNGLLRDATFRNSIIKDQDPSDAQSGSAMKEAKERAFKLQESLENLFFSKEPVINNAGINLGMLTRRFLVF